MTLIARLEDLDTTLYPPFPSNPETRTAARAILRDADGLIALLHVGTQGNHKIPGGGVEAGEDILQALIRELLEEAGCHAHNIRPLGRIEEYRARKGFLQISHCFTAEVLGSKGLPAFDSGELANGFSLDWYPPGTALQLLTEDLANPQNLYSHTFITRRELAILQAALT